MKFELWKDDSPPLPDEPPAVHLVLSKSTYSSATPLGLMPRLSGVARDLVGSIRSPEFMFHWCSLYLIFLLYGFFATRYLLIPVHHPIFFLLWFALVIGSGLAMVAIMLAIAGVFILSPALLLNLTIYPDLLNIYDDRFVLVWTKQGREKHLQIAWDWIKEVRLKDYLYMGTIPVQVLELELAQVPEASSQFALLNKIARTGVFEDAVSKRKVKQFELAGMRFPLPLFAFPQDVEVLIQTVRDKVGKSALDASVENRFASDNLESFTSMWLAELNSGKHQSLERQLAPGSSLCDGAYKVIGVMGHGGFSVVYDAEEARVDDSADVGGARRVAIKEIVCNFGGTKSSLEKNLRQMLQEASILSRLDHPQIVKFQRCFAEGNRLYIVMEALEGENLRDFVLSNPPLSEAQVLDLAAQCCSILQYLHSREVPIIHRDFTPDNLVNCTNVVKLLDFNIAQSTISNSAVTVVGKHCYMAPEQFCGDYTTRGDLYQLGATMYFLSTGVDPEPFSACDARARRPELSEEFQSLLSVLTSRDANDRPADASAVLQLVAACKPGAE